MTSQPQAFDPPLGRGERLEVYLGTARSLGRKDPLGNNRHAFAVIIDSANRDATEIIQQLRSSKSDPQRGDLAAMLAAFECLQDNGCQNHEVIIYASEAHILALSENIERLTKDKRRSCHELYMRLLAFLGKGAWDHVSFKPQPKDGIHGQRRVRALTLARLALGG